MRRLVSSQNSHFASSSLLQLAKTWKSLAERAPSTTQLTPHTLHSLSEFYDQSSKCIYFILLFSTRWLIHVVLPVFNPRLYRFCILINFRFDIVLFFQHLWNKYFIKYDIQVKPPPFVSYTLTIILIIFIQFKREWKYCDITPAFTENNCILAGSKRQYWSFKMELWAISVLSNWRLC